MFPLSKIPSQRVKKGSIIALGFTGVFVVASMLAPASGAWFFDMKQAPASLTTNSLHLGLSGGSGAQDSLEFYNNDFRPGDSRMTTFTVTNSGTIGGYVRMYADNLELAGITEDDLNSLDYSIDMYGRLSLTGGRAMAIDLDYLSAGDSRTYSMYTTLDNESSNDWQNATVSNTFNIMLSQE